MGLEPDVVWHEGREWIKTARAAEIVGLTKNAFVNRARKERMPHCRGRGHGFYFPKAHVEDLAEFLRVQRQWRARHQAIPRKYPIEPVDKGQAASFLIPSDEAARRLGIPRARLYALVLRGKVTAWQERPVRVQRRKRLWFSPSDIAACAADEEWIARRQRSLQTHTTRPHGTPDRCEWRHERSPDGPLRCLEKAGRLGELMTGPQAARRLGITPSTLMRLRRIGRLLGERLWQRGKPLRYWYYWPHEVEELAGEKERRAPQELPLPPAAPPEAWPDGIPDFAAAKHLTETGFGSLLPEAPW